MGDFVVGASFLTAFVAGLAALLAPCCITVLLPAYLGSVFKQRTKVFLMTFVFFLGLVAVFLPLGLGFASLGSLFSRYHNLIFTLGAMLLVGLGVALLSGRTMALPAAVHPELKGYGFGSVFVLGVFSGIATTCCAPVLAGVLALSALPGSLLLGGLYSLTYVVGMVAPLFLIALFLDRIDFTQKFFLFRRSVSYRVWGRQVTLTLANVVAGVMFVTFGAFILYLAQTDRLAMGSSDFLVTVNVYSSLLTARLRQLTQALPDVVWGGLAAILIGFALALAIRQIRSLRSGSRNH